MTHRPIEVTTVPRYILWCRFCRATWSETAHYHEAGKAHRCPLMLAALASGWLGGNPPHDFVACNAFRIEPVRWRNNALSGGKPTRCGSRCRQAKRGDCDCECHGSHHGKG